MLERFTGSDGPQLIAAALRNQSVFDGDMSLIETLCASAGVVNFQQGATIIEESAPDNDICFILAGQVSIKVQGREVAVRRAGQHIGEMAVVEPGQPRSASVVAMDDVVIARLSAAAFMEIAESKPALWRNIARELSARLRQRNQFITRPNSLPVLFVGCSEESLPAARAIQSALAHEPMNVRVWTDGIFRASQFPIESLELELTRADFAALVLAGDDTVVSRNIASNAPRDNIVFELGLFMGALGRSRTFLVQPRDGELKIPTDLMGITPLTYESGQEGTISMLVAPVCNELRNTILAAGPR